MTMSRFSTFFRGSSYYARDIINFILHRTPFKPNVWNIATFQVFLKYNHSDTKTFTLYFSIKDKVNHFVTL